MDWKQILISLPPRDQIYDYLHHLGVTYDYLMGKAVGAKKNQPYGRNVLHACEHGEVLLVSWLKDKFTALHDHGSGSGVICFYKGQCREEYWKWDSENGLEFLTKTMRREGEVCEVREKEIHRVKAMSSHTLSLHFYIPGSNSMRVFNPAKKCFYIVTDDCGAWEPREDQIVETVKW